MKTVAAPSRPWHRFYEARVPISPDFPSYSLPGMLSRTAERFSNQPSMILVGPNFDRRLTYAELEDLSGRFAEGLVRRGLRRGDRVAIILPNLPQYVIAAFGVWKASGVVVQVNPLYKGKELQSVLKDSGARFAVGLARFYKNVREIMDETSLETVILTGVQDFFPRKWRVLYNLLKARKEGDVLPKEARTVAFESVLRAPAVAAPVPVQQEDLAVLQYTGGTTGLSKGAMLSHRNIVSNVTQARSWLTDLSEGRERILSVVPFFHVFGMTVCMNLAVAIGATNIMVLMPGFVTRTVAEAINKYRPTIFPGVPAMYLAITQLKDIDRYDLKSIRACVSGASALPVEVQRRFEELTGARLVEGYGLSEASPLTHANPIYGTRKVGSIGVPVPGTDARIVDSDTGGQELAVGQTGELVVRGPQVMMGYWNNPGESAVALRNGWLYTGDIARVDADGFFFIEDRKKDMIKVGGLQVFPREVEEVLYEHPSVLEAAVVGVSSRVRGEMLVAHVVPKDGEDPGALKRELRQFCSTRLASYKVPRRFEIVKEIPKTLVGKALRRVIRDQESGRESPDEEA